MTASLHGPCPKCGYDPTAIVTARWEFTIARAVRSLNVRGTNRGRWAEIKTYKADRNAWGWEMRIARMNQRIPTATARRRVTLTRLYSGRAREFDRDNLVGGCKLIVDAMVSEGLLLDDDVARAELHYDQRKYATAGLLVVIEDLL